MFNWVFFFCFRWFYFINFIDNMYVEDCIVIYELLEEVLVGWFVYEFGYVCDYLYWGLLRMV